jgi:hypothetical protein
VHSLVSALIEKHKRHVRFGEDRSEDHRLPLPQQARAR